MSEGTDNNNLIDFGLTEDKSKGIIKVIGVGGGGCNAVNNMHLQETGTQHEHT